ncbi:hypothetical protein KL86DYS1_10291 [uncultured Dysgonomonas sp.]|uniref:Uncharacterized protein n=1 Tax=uncultured Dysgonomonas sp. TaxID=206096 RepID=A0A212IWE0_9BACT|nr:hypothetical protein KL86DYS1_10291 [uncultured Dysgonomonas sp.]
MFELIRQFGYQKLSSEFFRLAVSAVNGSAFEAGAKEFLITFAALAKSDTRNFQFRVGKM